MDHTEVGSSNYFENSSSSKRLIVRCDYDPPFFLLEVGLEAATNDKF